MGVLRVRPIISTLVALSVVSLAPGMVAGQAEVNPEASEGHVIHIIKGSMTGCDCDLYALKEGLESLSSVTEVVIEEFRIDLPRVEFLAYHPQGPRGYVTEYFEPLTTKSSHWTIYLLCGDKFDGLLPNQRWSDILGDCIQDYGDWPQLIFIYHGEVDRLCDKLNATCFNMDLDTEHACGIVGMHEFGHLNGLYDVSPGPGVDPCGFPQTTGIMVEHARTLTLYRYSSEEEEALEGIQRP